MKKKIIIFSLLFFIIFLSYFFWAGLFKATNKSVDFSVTPGQGTREIAENLKDEGLISFPVFFSYFSYRIGYLQPGVYKIEKGMTSLEIAKLLNEGKVQQYVVTIPEGWRVTQIDELLAEQKIIQKGELLKIASADEGKLFPDTYRLSLEVTPSEIKSIMLNNFEKKTQGKKITDQVLIIASIVEREAKFDEDRSKIAGVYLNRIEKGMRLEADPTIQYAKGSWEAITRANYSDVQSPYNTYLHDGLPPTPICNPGIKSIDAVLNPEKNGWLYFFHKDDGSAVYSETLEEHRQKLNNS